MAVGSRQADIIEAINKMNKINQINEKKMSKFIDDKDVEFVGRVRRSQLNNDQYERSGRAGQDSLIDGYEGMPPRVWKVEKGPLRWQFCDSAILQMAF